MKYLLSVIIVFSCSVFVFGQKYIDRKMEARSAYEQQIKTWSGRYDVVFSWQNLTLDTLIVVKRKGLYQPKIALPF